MNNEDREMYGSLYVVGTPIGNLSDFSSRGIETLKSVDFIAAEDTRVSVKLLNHFGIKKPLVSYHEHNMQSRGEIIIQRILNGENCAIVTDAGMPCISDPGEMLIKQCAQQNIPTYVVPGPRALISALAISGLPTGRFTFEGFLSMNRNSRIKHLEELKNESRTMIFYEAPHKLSNTLNDLFEYLGDRRISIVREITKIHEQVIRTTLSDAARLYADNVIKGEIVLIVEGKENSTENTYTMQDAIKLALELTETGLSSSEAAKQSAKITGFKKGDIYREII